MSAGHRWLHINGSHFTCVSPWSRDRVTLAQGVIFEEWLGINLYEGHTFIFLFVLKILTSTESNKNVYESTRVLSENLYDIKREHVHSRETIRYFLKDYLRTMEVIFVFTGGCMFVIFVIHRKGVHVLLFLGNIISTVVY